MPRNTRAPIITATWQAGLLSAISNILGQAIRCHQSNKPFTVNTRDFVHFVSFALLSCPLNFMWQVWLESRFPGYTEKQYQDSRSAEKQAERKDGRFQQLPNAGEKSLNVRNTAIKFGLDQTIGATVNTILFIAGIDLMRGRSLDTAMADCKQQFWPLVFAGIKLWPAVSILNFTLVPVQYRVVVGSIVGLFWGVYLSLISSSAK